MKRREFLLHSAAAGAALSAGSAILPRLAAAAAPRAPMDPAVSRELAMRALDAARSAGASYADFRMSGERSQALGTRERQITFFNDADSFGFGVRVLANGAWGFAASRETTPDEVVRVARQAVAQAQANAAARQRPVELAPTEAFPDAKWTSPIQTDPFSVPIEEKVDLLLRANAEALKVNGARFVNSVMFFLKLDKTFASTEGSYIEQTLYRSFPQMSITAVKEDFSDFQTRDSSDVAPRGLGYEHVRDANLPGNAGRWAEEAVRKLSAKAVEPGRYDLVLLPTHLWLTIHESIAHPTELDRIMGFEANYAGTSFIYPITDFLGKFRYGQNFMNIQGERTSPGGLSSIGWDDEGVKPDEFLIIKNGVINDLQTTREQAPWLKDWYAQSGKPVRSHGNSYAQSWDAVQFQRMPNVNLMPHPDRDVSLEELISGVENGIMIDGDGSFSIDQQRYNAQFGGQVYKEIRNGRIVGDLKDVAYQMRTPEFWNSMDLIGGESTYFVGGSFFDGKGQPSQVNAVSHGSPAARFRGVNVINTGRRA
ncbi:TldD/PmbA family protein [Longimicrobium terrae]|uniref:TldD protein n=1 Tax=Longimicrobium terrae TaxID=1639882 RepID=A0A841GWW6_9BACT|nr:TldD/PmbA family protein [Longimicrobium terrae]MBB4634114.1 TldD protein [Longimicrobium terrae]MBB6068996.1 TldD protein [Longimicrobium terrae]NNC28174.1 TldD/PmbA family protein [Longimicrobium terrae]